MTKRAAFIKNSYSLRATPGGFEAVMLNSDGSVFARYVDTDRAVLVSRVRRLWGHFNYEDETRAFAEIFA